MRNTLHLTPISTVSLLPTLILLSYFLLQSVHAEQLTTTIRITPPLVVGESRSHEANRVISVQKESIEHTPAQRTDELLRGLSSIATFRRSSSDAANPTIQGVSTRGLAPTATSRSSVLLDGIPLNDPFGGWVYWNRIPPELLESVEVLRSHHGSIAALDGSIHLRSKVLEEQVHSSVRGGSRGTFGGTNLSTVTLGDGSMLRFLGSFQHSDGYYLLSSRERGGIDRRADSESWNLRSDYEQQLGKDMVLQSSISYFNEERSNGTQLTGNNTDTALVSSVLRSEKRTPWTIHLYGQYQEFGNRFSAQSLDRESERPALDQHHIPSLAFGTGGLVELLETDALRLESGVSARFVDAEVRERFFFRDEQFQNLRRAGGQELTVSALSHLSHEARDSHSLSLGTSIGFWQRLDGKRFERRISNEVPLRNESFSDLTRLLFDVDLEGSIETTIAKFFAGARVHQRTPTLNELYRPFRVRNDITEANASLAPEKLYGLDIGATRSWSQWSIKTTVFWNEIEDSILNVSVAEGPGPRVPCGFVPEGGICRQRQNIGKLRSRGVETLLTAMLEPLTLRLSYAFVDSQIRSAPNLRLLDGNQTPQVPKHRCALEGIWSLTDAFTLNTRIRFTDEQFEDDLNQRVLPEVLIADAAIGAKLFGRYRLKVAIENIADATIVSAETAEGLRTRSEPRTMYVRLSASL